LILILSNGPAARLRGGDTSTRKTPCTCQGAGVKTRRLVPQLHSETGRERRTPWGRAGAYLNEKTDSTRQPRSPAQRGFWPFLPHKKGDLAPDLDLLNRTKIPDKNTRG